MPRLTGEEKGALMERVGGESRAAPVAPPSDGKGSGWGTVCMQGCGSRGSSMHEAKPKEEVGSLVIVR